MEAARPVSIWRLAAAGHATLLLAMGIGRFSYTPMVPPLITSGTLSEAEAGYVGACNLAGYLAGALCIPALGRRLAAVPMLRMAILICFLGIAASAVPAGFVWLAASRFVIGVAAAWMMVLALSIVVGSAPAATLGRATGTVFTGESLIALTVRVSTSMSLSPSESLVVRVNVAGPLKFRFGR